MFVEEYPGRPVFPLFGEWKTTLLYYIQEVQSLSLCARIVVFQWLLVVCFVDPRSVAYTLFYWWGGIHKGPCHELLWYFTRVLVDENLYITVFSRQHRFYISVQVGFLGDRLLGPIVCPNRPTGAVCHQWIGHGDLHDPLAFDTSFTMSKPKCVVL